MSLRDTLQRLEKQGDLVRVRREVDAKFELAAVAKKLDGGPAVLFERVRGHAMPVVVGVDGTKDRVAQNLGIQPRHLLQIYQKNVAKGRPTEVAIVIGLDTATRLAGATWGSNIPLELDEFAIAGGLRGHIITKIGIDATTPLARAERFELAKIPGYDALDLRDYLG